MILPGDPLVEMERGVRAWIEANGLLAIDGWLQPGNASAVLYCQPKGPDAWREFLQLAKAAQCPFIAIRTQSLTREDWSEEHDVAMASMHAARQADLAACEPYIGHLARMELRAVAPSNGGLVLAWEATPEWASLFFGGAAADSRRSCHPGLSLQRSAGDS